MSFKSLQVRQLFIALLTSTTLIQGSSIAFGSTPQAHSTPKPPCRVDMSNTHESTYFAEKYKIVSVKANATVICNQQIRNLVVFINLYKRSLLGPTLLKKFESSVLLLLPAGKRFKISGPFIVCSNFKDTEFFSTVSSTAVIAGHPVKAPWRRSYAQKLACGT